MRRKRQSGLTLVELIVAFTIMMVLTSMAVPLARYKVQRDKERDLEYALREIRTAIDKFKDDMDALTQIADAHSCGGGPLAARSVSAGLSLGSQPLPPPDGR